MAFELVVAVVVLAFDRRVLDCAVHPLDLPVGPRVIDFGEAMLEAVFPAAHLEHVRDVAGRRAIGLARRIPELDAVVGQDRMDLAGNCRDQGDEEA